MAAHPPARHRRPWPRDGREVQPLTLHAFAKSKEQRAVDELVHFDDLIAFEPYEAQALDERFAPATEPGIGPTRLAAIHGPVRFAGEERRELFGRLRRSSKAATSPSMC